MTAFRSFSFLTLLATVLFFTTCGVKEYPSNSMPVKHDLWDELLQKHVSPAGWVDYRGLIEDSTRLNEYLDLLSRRHPNDKNWTRDEQLAYWINAYNAFTVKLIVDHYPVESIKDIKNGIPFVNTVWDIKFIQIEGATYDLNNIEHGIIRPNFKEPRIHFAVNCASVSCPKLQPFAYTTEKLDEQLTRAAREFLADESRNKFLGPNKAELSKIFSWYQGDFTREMTLVEFINQYAPIRLLPNAEIGYLDYDWGLNEEE